ncbi:MAG: hypothetical protein WEE89_16695 [Gemmatimonadota bacterium]
MHHRCPGRSAGVGFGFAIILAIFTGEASAQWSRVYDQFYLPASHNWQFRHNYPAADRMFNAFDYGHAILYETLYNYPDAPPSRLEEKEYDFITRELLVHPPNIPLEEGAIEIAYAKLAPEAKAMFDWAHLLHRQIYDVWADESIALAQKDARVAELLRYYKTRRELAFSSTPKSMDIMDGHPYSGEFRQKYPKFNGLIWAYHWLQIGLYEPLLLGKTPDERQTGVLASVGRFWQMLETPPEKMPRLMPMTAAVAPLFATRYPEAGIIFDNLHMMHDVVSDVLTSSKIPRKEKRKELLRVAELFRDRTSYATTVQEWRDMAEMMGVHNMGGTASGGIFTALPEGTVPRGMSMAGMNHANMPGMQPGRDTTAAMQHANMPGMQQRPAARDSMAGMQHANMPGMRPPPRTAADSMAGMQHAGTDMERMMAMHERMIADPVIRERMMTDPVLQRMMSEMMTGMSAGGSTANQAALSFVVQLLSDPAVQARIKTDPELQKLWADPDVQRLLEKARREKTPAPHKH